MRVRLLYFAAVRDLLATDEESIDLPPEVQRIADLARWLEEARPALAGRLGEVRFAIDESFASPSDPLHVGAVVALIPPVAGG